MANDASHNSEGRIANSKGDYFLPVGVSRIRPTAWRFLNIANGAPLRWSFRRTLARMQVDTCCELHPPGRRPYEPEATGTFRYIEFLRILPYLHLFKVL